MASLQHDICAICLEQPKNPKSLPTCTHLFCEACLNSYIRRHETEESVSCPTCTMACPTQDINIEGTAESEPISRPTTKEPCTFCSYKGLEAKAEFFCDRCEDAFLCQACAASHGKKPRFRGHGAKPLSDFTRLARCTRHAGRAMKYLCMGCDEPACEICAEVEHDDHELVDIGEVSKKLKNYNLEPLCIDYECASTLQRQLQDIRNKEKDVIALIQNQAARLKERIEKRKDVLVSAVKAKAEGKQLDMDICGLVENLQGSLECASDISEVDITNAKQVRNALSTEAALNKTRLESSRTIPAFKSRMVGMSVPRFVPKEGVLVGELEYLPSTITDPVRLELGGTYVRVPCYKIGKAVPFIHIIRRPIRFSLGTVLQNVVFVEKNKLRGANRWSLQMGGHQKPTAAVRGPRQEAIDMIVNNKGELLLLTEDQLYRYIPPDEQDGKKGPLQSINGMDVDLSVSVALTKTGQYVLLHKDEDYLTLCVSIFSADSKLIWGPIALTLPPEQGGEGLKILCPESTDLLLIHDAKGEKVSAVSLAVKQDSMVGGEFGELERYFARRTPILPPVEGFYILDICCDDGKVYLCIKKGTSKERAPEAGPIQFYQATYTNDKWHYIAIPLEDPTGKPFSELKKDEMLQLGAHKGILMCLVYSPIPLAEQKESKEPGMNITWYHGKLP